MDSASVFVAGVAITTVCSAVIVWYLKPYLQDVLVDLCGTVQRAAFWTAFSTISMVLTPVVFAMHFRPHTATTEPAVFALGSQLELALIGLLLSIFVLGAVMSKFIPRTMP
jgi:hypothetical protein